MSPGTWYVCVCVGGEGGIQLWIKISLFLSKYTSHPLSVSENPACSPLPSSLFGFYGCNYNSIVCIKQEMIQIRQTEVDPYRTCLKSAVQPYGNFKYQINYIQAPKLLINWSVCDLNYFAVLMCMARHKMTLPQKYPCWNVVVISGCGIWTFRGALCERGLWNLRKLLCLQILFNVYSFSMHC